MSDASATKLAPKALPPQPHIDWLKKAAKERLADLRARERCPVTRAR